MKRMSPRDPDDSDIGRILGAAQRTSVSVILGLLLAIPGLLAINLLAPYAVGFYLIAAAATVAHVSLKAINPDNIPDTDEELSELQGKEAVLFIFLMMTTLIIGINLKLLFSAGLALAVSLTASETTLAISIAILFPVFDREMAEVKWYLSVAGLSAVGILLLLATGLRAINMITSISEDTLKETSLRLAL